LLVKRAVVETSCVSHFVLPVTFPERDDVQLVDLPEGLLGSLVLEVFLWELGGPAIGRIVEALLIDFLDEVVLGVESVGLALAEEGAFI
jgi:hypothetical protein